MLINEKIVRQIVRKHLLEEVSKKIQKIKLLNEEVKFKQDPAYEKGKSKFLLVPGPKDKKEEFIKLSKTIRDHLSGKMGVTGNPNYKTAISNLSTDAKVDKIISDIASGKDAGMKAGLFKKYGEYIKGQSGEIPTNLKRYVEEYVDQIETKIEDGEKNKDNIIKVSEQAAITVMDKEAEKRSSQPRTKKKKEKEEEGEGDFLSGDPKDAEKEKEDPEGKGAEKTDTKGSGQAAAKSDEKVYRLKGELSQSEPDKFWGYYTLIDGNWNYIQKKKGGWKPEDGRDKGEWRPVKGQKAVDKLNGGILIDVSTNKPETQNIKGKADPAAKKKRASGKTTPVTPNKVTPKAEPKADPETAGDENAEEIEDPNAQEKQKQEELKKRAEELKEMGIPSIIIKNPPNKRLYRKAKTGSVEYQGIGFHRSDSGKDYVQESYEIDKVIGAYLKDPKDEENLRKVKNIGNQFKDEKAELFYDRFGKQPINKKGFASTEARNRALKEMTKGKVVLKDNITEKFTNGDTAVFKAGTYYLREKPWPGNDNKPTKYFFGPPLVSLNGKPPNRDSGITGRFLKKDGTLQKNVRYWSVGTLSGYYDVLMKAYNNT